MRNQTSASVFGASGLVFMWSMLPKNRAPVQQHGARDLDRGSHSDGSALAARRARNKWICHSKNAISEQELRPQRQDDFHWSTTGRLKAKLASLVDLSSWHQRRNARG